MGEPSPDDAQSQAHGHGGSGSERPDWLVGADEGVEAETRRTKPSEVGPPPPLKLIRPAPREDEPVPARPEPLPAPLLSRPAAEDGPLELTSDPGGTGMAGGAEAPRIVSGKKPAEPKPSKPVPWAAAASSVPALRAARATPPPPLSVVPGGAQRPAPEPERSHAAPEMVEARWVQSPEPATRPEEADLEFPDDAAEPAPTGAPHPVRHAVAPPRESWWVVALDAIRSDVRIHIALGVLAVAIAAYFVWPRAEQGASLRAIRHNPERFDGARVFVRGKVGEVFSLGGGYAFYLHQGRDTLVVFTRGAMPQSRKAVSVKGTIQTGFLDGAPRQALFADPE